MLLSFLLSASINDLQHRVSSSPLFCTIQMIKSNCLFVWYKLEESIFSYFMGQSKEIGPFSCSQNSLKDRSEFANGNSNGSLKLKAVQDKIYKKSKNLFPTLLFEMICSSVQCYQIWKNFATLANLVSLWQYLEGLFSI